MCQIENAFSILFRVGFEPEQDVPRIRHALLARALVNTPKTLYDGATLWTLHNLGPNRLVNVNDDVRLPVFK